MTQAKTQYLNLKIYIIDRKYRQVDGYECELHKLLSIMTHLGDNHYSIPVCSEKGNIDFNIIPGQKVITSILGDTYEFVNDFIRLYNETINSCSLFKGAIPTISMETLTPSILYNVKGKFKVLQKTKKSDLGSAKAFKFVMNNSLHPEEKDTLSKFIEVLNSYNNKTEVESFYKKEIAPVFEDESILVDSIEVRNLNFYIEFLKYF